MNPILANMAARRSIRSFLPDTPPPYQLREILEAGRMAPSGGNKQACHFLVIQSPDILAELSQRAVAAFAQMEASPDTYESLASSIRKAKQGAYDFLYGAPVLVLVANLIDHGNAHGRQRLCPGKHDAGCSRVWSWIMLDQSNSVATRRAFYPFIPAFLGHGPGGNHLRRGGAWSS